MRTHIPFKNWCPHCAKGRRKNDPRRATKENEDQEVLLISWDDMEKKGKHGRVTQEDEGRNKTLTRFDGKNKCTSAIVAQKKRSDSYTAKAVGGAWEFCVQQGHRKVGSRTSPCGWKLRWTKRKSGRGGH